MGPSAKSADEFTGFEINQAKAVQHDGDVTPGASGGAIKRDVPRRAITPGQACVMYHEDMVVGGGWIAS